MKKYLSMILIFALLLCLCACKPADSDDGTAVPQTTEGSKETAAVMTEREPRVSRPCGRLERTT